MRLEYLENAFGTVDVDLAPSSTETATESIEPFVLAEIGLTAARTRYAFPTEWAGPLAALAEESGYDTTDVVVIEERFNAFLDRVIDAAASLPSA